MHLPNYLIKPKETLYRSVPILAYITFHSPHLGPSFLVYILPMIQLTLEDPF